MHSSACFHVFFRPGILSQRAGSHHQKVSTLTNCSLSVLTDRMKDSGSWPSFSSSLCSRSLHLPKKSPMKKRHRNKNNGCSLCRAGMASHKVNRHGSHPKRSLEHMHIPEMNALCNQGCTRALLPHFLPFLVVNTVMTYLKREIMHNAPG